MESVWVLTSEYNDYDQHGEYFEKVYKCRPSADELAVDTVSSPQGEVVQNLLLKGGGRIDWEGKWYNLVEHKL